MKQKRSYIIFSSFFLVLFSASLMVSTLHSHNHIEWHHPKKHTDTGHCLTVDSTACPICAYLFDADYNPVFKAKILFNNYEIAVVPDAELLTDLSVPTLPGRSPPFSA